MFTGKKYTPQLTCKQIGLLFCVHVLLCLPVTVNFNALPTLLSYAKG